MVASPLISSHSFCSVVVAFFLLVLLCNDSVNNDEYMGLEIRSESVRSVLEVRSKAICHTIIACLSQNAEWDFDISGFILLIILSIIQHCSLQDGFFHVVKCKGCANSTLHEIRAHYLFVALIFSHRYTCKV